MRKSTSLFAILAVLFALMPHAASAQLFVPGTWVSGTGSDANTMNSCLRANPCQTLAAAISVTAAGGTVSCADPDFSAGTLSITRSLTIDCAADFAVLESAGSGMPAITIAGAGINVTLRGLTIFSDTMQPLATAGVKVAAAATVRIENCKIFGIGDGPAVAVTPSSAGTTIVKIQDSTFTASAGGISVIPSGGASALLTVERSRIENNTGGGIRIDSTNAGTITANVTDSSVSFNASAGINAVSGSGGQNVINLSGDVLASNGAVGLQANGANAAALVQNTSLSNNTTALSAVNGGRILSYGNNSIVGTAGTGFSGSASLQ